MNTRFAVPLTLGIFMAIPAFAQRPEERPQGRPQEHQQEHREEHRDNVHGNQGRIPQAAPPKRDYRARPEVDHREGGRINTTPHVSNDHWFGHDRPNDRRYVVDHPFEHGRFEHFGPSYRYRVERFDRDHHRFWFPGGHEGWYLIYNVHTGVYIHAQYMGS